MIAIPVYLVVGDRMITCSGCQQTEWSCGGNDGFKGWYTDFRPSRHGIVGVGVLLWWSQCCSTFLVDFRAFFGSWTESPMASGANSFGCCTGVFRLIRWRLASASSRLSAISCHSFRNYLRSLSERWSRIGRPKSVVAGELPVCWLGVTFSRRMRLAVLTPTSALPLLWG